MQRGSGEEDCFVLSLQNQGRERRVEKDGTAEGVKHELNFPLLSLPIKRLPHSSTLHSSALLQRPQKLAQPDCFIMNNTVLL